MSPQWDAGNGPGSPGEGDCRFHAPFPARQLGRNRPKIAALKRLRAELRLCHRRD
jgi:hypothetical protein